MSRHRVFLSCSLVMSLAATGCPSASVDAAADARPGYDVLAGDTQRADAAIHDRETPDRAGDSAVGGGDRTLPTSATVVATLGSSDDAVASYLMDPGQGAWNLLGGADVPLGRHWDTDHVSYHTALRFAGVPVPAGATIDRATLTLSPTNEVDSSNNLWLDIYAERSADSAPFDLDSYVSGRPDQRLRTTAAIDHWLVRCHADCTELEEYDCPQRQRDCWDRNTRFDCPKDLRLLVQEVIDQPGWQPGQALTILLVNAAVDADGADYRSSRNITGFDPLRGSAFYPTLTIEYHTP